MKVCQKCLGKCCRNFDTGYRCAHMAAQVYMHECEHCISGTEFEVIVPNPAAVRLSNAELVLSWDLHRQMSELEDRVRHLEGERERLLDKLAQVESLSKHAWEQVERNPADAVEVLRSIYAISK